MYYGNLTSSVTSSLINLNVPPNDKNHPSFYKQVVLSSSYGWQLAVAACGKSQEHVLMAAEYASNLNRLAGPGEYQVSLNTQTKNGILPLSKNEKCIKLWYLL